MESAQTKLEQMDFSSFAQEYAPLLNRFGVSTDSVQSFLSDLKVSSGEETAERLALWIVEPIAKAAGIAVSFIVLFFIICIAIRISVKALDLISKLPFLNFSNHLFGLVLGGLWGFFLAFLISGILTLAQPIIQGNELAFLQEFNVEKTYLLRFFSSFDWVGVFQSVKG
jgi:hypothetical protein